MVSSLYNICNLCTRVVTNATAKATTTEWFGAAGASSTTKVASKTTTTTSTTASKATCTTTTGTAAEVAPMTTDLACPVGVNGTQWFGPDCRFRCNCATGSSCARSNGECGECREGYSGTSLFVYSSPIRDQPKLFRIGVWSSHLHRSLRTLWSMRRPRTVCLLPAVLDWERFQYLLISFSTLQFRNDCSRGEWHREDCPSVRLAAY